MVDLADDSDTRSMLIGILAAVGFLTALVAALLFVTIGRS